MVTFFHEDGSLNADGTAEFAAWLLDHGSDSILVSGTTGEAPTMTYEEKEELFTKVIARTKGKGQVIVGTGSNNTADVLEMNKLAEKVGADGVLVVGPYYNKPSQEASTAITRPLRTTPALPIIHLQRTRTDRQQHPARHHCPAGPRMQEHRGHQGSRRRPAERNRGR